jgi:hypothetical protein
MDSALPPPEQTPTLHNKKADIAPALEQSCRQRPRLPSFRKERERMGHPYSICDLDSYTQNGWATRPRSAPQRSDRLD